LQFVQIVAGILVLGIQTITVTPLETAKRYIRAAYDWLDIRLGGFALMIQRIQDRAQVLNDWIDERLFKQVGEDSALRSDENKRRQSTPDWELLD